VAESATSSPASLRLCNAIAERLMDRYSADSVRVKAAKPEPPIPLPVEEVSVEVWREA